MPPKDPGFRSAYLLEVAGATGLAGDLVRLAAALRIDGMVIDCNLSWALEARIKTRSAVLVHTAAGLYLPVWQAVLDAANRRRAACRLPTLARADVAWGSADRLLVASLRHFDRRLPTRCLHPTYVGPVATPPVGRRAWPVQPVSGRPLVVVSFSTDNLQNGPNRVQTALDALAGLPVGVLTSTSGVFPATRLSVPANAAVGDYLPHESVMPVADVAVCHAGHGTTMAALCHGVPLVCIPGLGRDQAPIAARVAELGLGIALPGNAAANDIKDAVSNVLGNPAYRLRAQRFAGHAGRRGGGRRAALEIEAMLGDDPAGSSERPDRR